MKRLLYLTLLIISVTIQAQDCDDQGEHAIVQGFFGECNVNTDIDMLVLELLKDAETVCSECTPPGPNFFQDSKKARQETYKNMVMDSVKKSLAQVTVDLFKLRSTYDIGLNVDSTKCDIAGQLSNQCPNIDLSKDLKEMQTEFANEMAMMISGKRNLKPCLFETEDEDPKNKEMNNSPCNSVTESQLLFIETKTVEKVIEDSLASKIINIAKAAPADKSLKEMLDLLSSGDPKLNKEIDLIKNHPLIKYVMNSPEASKKYLSSISVNDNPAMLVKKFFSTELTNQFKQEKIDGTCQKIVGGLKDYLCNSNDFKEGNIFSNKPSAVFTGTLSGDMIRNQTRNYCIERKMSEQTTLQNLRNFDKSLKEQTGIYTNLPSFQSDKRGAYSQTFGATRTLLCTQNLTCPNSENTIPCYYQSIWKSMSQEGTLEYAQSRASDPGINKILSNILGQAQDITPETRKYLVEQRILPNENGEVLAQPRIAERETGYSAPSTNSSNATNKTAKTASTNKAASSDRKPSNESNQNAASSPDIYNVDGNSSNSSNASFDSLQPNNQVGQQASNDVFNQELLNRLMKNRTQPFTEKEARKMIEQQLKDTKYSGAQVPPQVLNKAVDDFYDYTSQSVNMGQSSAAQANYAEGSNNKAARAKSASEKKYNDLLVKAMESRSSTATPSVSEAKNEKKPEGSGQATKEIAITASSTDSIASLLNGNQQLNQLKDEEFILVINEHKFKVDRFFNITKLSNAPEKLFTEVQSFFNGKFSKERKKSLRDLNRTFSSTGVE